MQVARIKAGGRAFAQIAKFHPELTAFRRDLHAHPELGFEEKYTSARIAEALRSSGVDEVHEGIGKTGIVALIHGQSRSSGRPPTTMTREAWNIGLAAVGPVAPCTSNHP